MTNLNEYLLIEQVADLEAQLAALTLRQAQDAAANQELTFAFNLARETCQKLEAERDSFRAALAEIAYRVKPRGLLARWLVERARGALNEPTNQPTRTGEWELEPDTGEQGQ